MKPVVVGMNNPHSDDPSKALGPEPINSAGYRLWLMVKEAANRQGRDFTERDYLTGFDRINLVQGLEWDVSEADENVERIKVKLLGRTVVLCGKAVASALGLRGGDGEFSLTLRSRQGLSYYLIPHPSGLTRQYNDVIYRTKVSDLLYSLYKGK